MRTGSITSGHGQKNWMFAGSERGGKAVAFALIETLSRIADHKINRIDELLANNYLADEQPQGRMPSIKTTFLTVVGI